MAIKTHSDLPQQVSRCTHCVDLPLGPRPVLQWHPDARLLIAGQAPGRKVHESGVPFQDASGQRLREWLGLSETTFYDAHSVAILPMAFCYPGTGSSGDLPPRPECSARWRAPLMNGLCALQLTIVLGKYALDYHCDSRYRTLTAAVKDWKSLGPGLIVLPHPSPRNNRWIKQNPWFETELLAPLRERIQSILA